MIFHVKSGLLTLSLGGATLCYKIDEYRVNRCVEDQTALKCPKIINKNSSGDEIANVNFFYNIAHVEASAYAH